MITIHLVLLLIALVCLFCAAVGVSAQRVNLGWMGLFFWALSSVF